MGNTIEGQRSELELLIKHSPSLRNYYLQVFDQAWNYALKRVCKDYPQVNFPDRRKYSQEIEAILSIDFWLSEP